MITHYSLPERQYNNISSEHIADASIFGNTNPVRVVSFESGEDVPEDF